MLTCANGATEFKRVVATKQRTTPETLAITVADWTGWQRETVVTTPEHPFYVENRGFVPAGRLAIGNAIVTRAGPARFVTKVEEQSRPEGVSVYNLTIEDDHTYFVGHSDSGLWVHNYTPTQAFEVGAYNDLKRRAVGLGFEIHHLPQSRLAGQVIPGYSHGEGLAIALPRALHRGLPSSSRLTGIFTGSTPQEVRALISQQLRDLNNAGVPKSALDQIGQSMRRMYPSIYR